MGALPGPRLSPVTTLADLTTLRLGGPAPSVVTARDEAVLLRALTPDALVVGGGSNLVVADAGVDVPVVLVRTTGIQFERSGDLVLVTVAAGEVWDDVVAECVEDGLSGIEALSGIPGATGATPIQNVGAYGQDVSQTITAVRVWDRTHRRQRVLTPGECGFGYRDSALKRDPGRHAVLAVTFALHEDPDGAPVAYAELARTLGVAVGDRVPAADVRAAVLDLRRGKGMVLDPADPDTRSAGSFFTNPILSPAAFAALRERAGADLDPPAWPEADGRVKTSAAWLIQHAGFQKGHGDPDGIAISSKHVLALTNRGRGTTAELVALAHEIADGVFDRFGVDLVPEPVFAGHAWR
jgi:UDP-N-acetylmuramate dehydrogenase